MKAASAAATVVSAANRASAIASQTVETARTEILKEPLGFIKIIQLLIAIITFAVAVNGGDTVKISVKCPSNTDDSVSASYSYPYDLANSKWSQAKLCTFNSTRQTISDSSTSIVASAGFFVFTGVISFLYAIAFIIIYVFFRHKYTNLVFFPISDFILTSLITLFWFIGSIAWSKAVDDLKTATDANSLFKIFLVCSSSNCKGLTPTYASVVISCIFGFGNFFIWSGNVWFVLKETVWYKNRQQAQQQQASASYNPNDNKI